MSSANVRVGVGYDIHLLVEGRPLILGGVPVAHRKGLQGHSDADVVLHAVADALLGGAGLPDIGELYPDTDPAWKDADSRKLLADVVERVRSAGYRAGNIDVIVHAETPKISPYKQRMAAAIATITGLATDRVSVKAKTNEGIGAVGQSDAIACTAVVLVVSDR